MREIFMNIFKHELIFDPEKWDNISKLSKEFIIELLKADPEDRPTAQEGLKHKWIK